MTEWLRDDERGVSTTLGYTLTLSMTVVLIAGLLAAGGSLVEDQRRTVAGDELDVAGQQLAAGFEDADRLAGSADDPTARVNVWLPEQVVNREYEVRVENRSTTSDQPARAAIVTRAEGMETERSVSFRTINPVENRTLPGGPMTIAYEERNGSHKLVASERQSIAPEEWEGAAIATNVVDLPGAGVRTAWSSGWTYVPGGGTNQ
ncbi:MAG: DUF7266 family protein [Halanaeroarchaeum sp.]